MPEAVPLNLPFDEAIAFFARKGLALSPNSWMDVWGKANVRSFTVARVTALDVLSDIRSEVKRAIESGTSLSEFKKNLIPRLRDKGWFAPAGEAAKVVMPDGTERKRLAPWRLDTIYRTNMQSAYSAGRYKQMMEVADQRPYWQYMAVMDAKTRTAHAAQNGKVYDYRHPFWVKWFPPSGFNCRCYVKSLSGENVKARGLEIQTLGTDLKPDPGWDYNPGENFLQWENLPANAVFRETSGQKTYLDYGRPDVRSLPESARQQAPALLPTSTEVGREEALEYICRAVGLQEGETAIAVSTGDLDQAIIGRKQLGHLLDADDGREKYAGFILPTLKKPFEVYLTEYESAPGMSVWRKRYIGLFQGAGKRDYVVVLDQGKDGTVFWNAFTREKAKINKMRTGELVYGEPV